MLLGIIQLCISSDANGYPSAEHAHVGLINNVGICVLLDCWSVWSHQQKACLNEMLMHAYCVHADGETAGISEPAACDELVPCTIKVRCYVTAHWNTCT